MNRTAFKILAAAFTCAVIASASPLATGAAGATTAVTAPSNFVATGHDMDYHCSGGEAAECAYLKILVDKVRNGSTLPILALDQGTELTDALADAGETTVVTVDPSNATAFNATPFTSPTGTPLYSAIITASAETCGGCDNTTDGEANINARATDFATFFNAGGGILALAGADDLATYYNFVPLGGVSADPVTEPFTVTAAGAALGITDEMVNCCATHNSFKTPSSPFVVLETDSAGLAETIGAFNVSIGGGAFGHAPVANDQTVTTTPDTAVNVTLSASDADADPLTYTVVTPPAHGTLTGTAPNLVYTPAAGFAGTDSFTFKANDGQLDSNTATVTIQVTPVLPIPAASFADMPVVISALLMVVAMLFGLRTALRRIRYRA